MSQNTFLPVCRADLEARGWEQLDFLYITGDAYVDHPSFGHAIISRVLESHGYRVGLLPQPDWRSAEAFKAMGKPRLGVLITAGNIDSMVNHYTAAKKPRREDLYSPGGKRGFRPDRATIVYANRIREAFGDIPILIGGVEASLRRFAHYDYWDDKVRRSILFDSRADILMYGMGEKQIVEIADCLASGMDVHDITYIPGTCYITANPEFDDSLVLASCEDCMHDKQQYANACRMQYYEQNPYHGKRLLQAHGNRYLVQNPPMPPLETAELDQVYALPFTRRYHPMYEKDGGIPAINEVKFSIASSRGCFGGCNFCALAFHQGRIVTARSQESILTEAKSMIHDPDFKGYIHDVGGPTANFRAPACKKQLTHGACKNRQCLFPTPCKNMTVSHKEYLSLLAKLRALPGVKKVFIRSGIRFDYLMHDKDDTFLHTLCKHHVSGQLKVAPEHVSDRVLQYMGKPSHSVYQRFSEKFYQVNKQLGKKQFLVPYLMSSHPGSTLSDAIRLAVYLKEHGLHPEQVQDFYPTPGTISTCMFYTGLDPVTMQPVYIPKTPKEKAMQRALLQFRNPDNYKLVQEALTKAGRTDLIGDSPRCLIPPEKNRRKEYGKTTQREAGFPKNQGRTGTRGGKAKSQRHSAGTGGHHRGR